MNTPLTLRSSSKMMVGRATRMRRSPPPSPVQRLRAIAERIVRDGAMILRANSAPMLVGDFRWKAPNQILWFSAFGEVAADAGMFSFHYATADASRVVFRHAGGGVLELTTIERAAIDDRDQCRVAWEIWRHVARTQSEAIAEAYRKIARRA